MKILCVLQDFPWPTRLGTHLRSQQVVTSLAALGELDLFSLVYPNRPEPCDLPPDVHVTRLEIVTGAKPVYSVGRRLRWIVSRGRPLEVIASESDAVRTRFDEWADGPYDLAWFNRGGTYELLGRPELGRTIVDLDDLEDQKILGRLEAMRRRPAAGGVVGRIRRHVAALQARRNASRWAALQRSVARSVDVVVLCSQHDVEVGGFLNAIVVPNGYDPPPQPLGRIDVGDPPVIMFQGSMRYGPNTDGAQWFVTEIAPLIRERLPRLEVRLVGDPDGVVMGLDRRPQVTVVGSVESMDEELARADLAVVPLRYASGTRLKILEALAHRVPVVSTAIGAQGLGLESGRHLLVADDAEGFAQACVAALTQPELRRRLVAEGQSAFLQSHQWSMARERIRTLAQGSPTPASSGPGSS